MPTRLKILILNNLFKSYIRWSTKFKLIIRINIFVIRLKINYRFFWIPDDRLTNFRFKFHIIELKNWIKRKNSSKSKTKRKNEGKIGFKSKN